MIRTAKEWAEIIAKIAEADPDQKIWIYCYTKADVEVHNSTEPNGNVSEADWNDIIGEFDGLCSGSALEPVWEAFSDAVGSELSHIRCDDCYEYDYQVKGEKYERKCANCGEEQDLLDQ